MFTWNYIGYLGIFFAGIYRIPQIIKIYKTKKGGDISKRSFLLQSSAYICFIIYIVMDKETIDYLLLSYYLMGIFQNIFIIAMKKYYKEKNSENNENNVKS